MFCPKCETKLAVCLIGYQCNSCDWTVIEMNLVNKFCPKELKTEKELDEWMHGTFALRPDPMEVGGLRRIK